MCALHCLHLLDSKIHDGEESLVSGYEYDRDYDILPICAHLPLAGGVVLGSVGLGWIIDA